MRRDRGRKRRGLSPLIASVLLISATVLGGVLVYQYFQSSLSNVKTLSQDIMVTANAIVLNENATIVKVSVTNQYSYPITLTGIFLLDSDGNSIPATPLGSTTINIPIEPGDKTTVLMKTTKNPAFVYVIYKADGETHRSEPVPINK